MVPAVATLQAPSAKPLLVRVLGLVNIVIHKVAHSFRG